MTDETPQNPDELKRRPRSTPDGEMSASLIFSELVRQAAERRASENKDERPDVPPAKSSVPEFFEDDKPLPEIDRMVAEARRNPRPPRQKPSEIPEPQKPPEIPESPASMPVIPPIPADKAPPAPENKPAAAPVSDIPLIPEPQIPAPSYTQAAARALTEEERRAAAALEAERIRRVKKRQAVRQTRRVGILGGVVRALLVVSFASALMATILSWFTSPEFLQPEMRRNLSVALYTERPTPTPTVAPTPNWAHTIGIVSGHRGPGQFAAYDPGAVCEDGLTENEINFAVASEVVVELRKRGYSVLLLDEFDTRLNDFQAAALISIHSNTCRDFGEVVSGFLVAKAAAKPSGGPDDQLANCVGMKYAEITGMAWRPGATIHMTDYHSFREIHPLTPGAILELGFMRADREMLVNQRSLLARGITEGILCFMEPTDPFGILPATPQPTPSPIPDI